MSKEIPADWAICRALVLTNRDPEYHLPLVKAQLPHNGTTLAFARYIAEHEEPPVDPGHLGLACAAVADAVFYHNNDSHQRSKLALALVDLAQEIQRQAESSK